MNSHYSSEGRSEISAVKETSLVFTIVKYCCIDLYLLQLGFVYDPEIYYLMPGVGKLRVDGPPSSTILFVCG